MPEYSSQTEASIKDSRSNVVALAPFEEWTYEDALKAARDQLFPEYSVVEAYCVDKDHFQRGTQWVGPGDAQATAKIGEQFAPDDVVGEALSNIQNAFSEPQVGTALRSGEAESDEQLNKSKELLVLLSHWWDKRRLQEQLQKCVRYSSWAGWANARLFIPWRFLSRDADGNIVVENTASFEEALDMITVMVPKPNQGVTIIDASTQDSAFVYLDTEVEYVGGKRKDYARAEIMYLDPKRKKDSDAKLIVRVVYGNEEKPSTRVELETKGSFLGAEMRSNRVITDPVIRTQRQLNLATTIITRLLETAAFRERYTKNAKPQGLRIPYNDGDSLRDGAFLDRDEDGREWQVIPIPRTLGAATTTELVGLPTRSENGDVKGNAPVDVFIADPVDPGPYILAADGIRRRILRMCGQGHLGGVSNAESSGIAYEQARAVFEKLLLKMKVSEEGMVRDLLTSVVTLAEILSNQRGAYTDIFRITVDQHVNPGPRSPDLVRLDLESYEMGVLSKETALSKLGVEDTKAELERIHNSSNFILGVFEKVAALQGFDKESVVEILSQLDLPKNLLQGLEFEEVPEPVPPGSATGDEENL